MNNFVQAVLWVLAAIGFAFGALLFYQAEKITGSAIHEIEALIAILIGTVALGAQAIVAQLKTWDGK